METIKLTPHQANIIKTYLQQELKMYDLPLIRVIKKILSVLKIKNVFVSDIYVEILAAIEAKSELDIDYVRWLIDNHLYSMKKIHKALFSEEDKNKIEYIDKFNIDTNPYITATVNNFAMLEVLERLRLTLNNETTENPV